MRIAIIGYGRMGRTIERLALEQGDEIACRIDIDNQEDFGSDAFRNADVAIEFSVPAMARENVLRAVRAGVPVVSGTTGWKQYLPEVEEECRRLGGSMIWASNFSVGVNLFMAVNRHLARIMEKIPGYYPRIVETHHIHKLDHPSGTAVTLAEELIACDHNLRGWEETDGNGELPADVLGVEYIRAGEIPGIHTVSWDSQADDITITHSAKNRDGFASGALAAARWLTGHPGIHSFIDMLSDITGHELLS